MLQKFRRLLLQKGQGVVEYALILGFVAVVTFGLFGDDSLKSTFKNTLRGIMGQFTKYNNDYDKTTLTGGGQNGSGFQPGPGF